MKLLRWISPRTMSKLLLSPLVAFYCLLMLQNGFAQKTEDAFSQTYRALLLSTGSDASIDSSFNQLLRWHAQAPGQYDSLIPSLLMWRYQQRAKDLNADERLPLLYQFEKILEATPGAPVEDLAKWYALYIPVFRFRYQDDSVDHYLDHMQNELEKLKGPSPTMILWYYEKGRYAYQQGEYDAELQYCQLGLEYLKRYFPDQLRYKYLLVNAVGIANRKSGRIDEAIAVYESALETAKYEIDSVKLTGAILNNLGLAYKDCGDWVKAIQRMHEAIRFYQQKITPVFEDIGSGYDNIAICYQGLGKLDSALHYSRKSMEFIRTNLGPMHPDLLLPMSSITYSYILQGRFKEALQINLRARSFLNQLGWEEDAPEGDYFVADGFDVFDYAVRIYQALYQMTRDTAYLHRAAREGDHFMALTDYAYDNLQNDLSKDIFQAKHGGVFDACIDIFYTLFEKTQDAVWIEKAFAYSERFKSLELLYAAQKDKAEKIERFRPLQQEYTVQMDSIHYFERLETDAEDEKTLLKARQGLDRLKTRLYQWKENLRKVQPEYFQLLYHPEPVTLAALQKRLMESDLSLMAYHVAGNRVFLFVVSPDEVRFIRKEMPRDVADVITEFRHAITDYFTHHQVDEELYKACADSFAGTGHALYQYLFEPAASSLTHRVIIIVDKSLGYLPFDLLVREAPARSYHFRQYHYLLETYAMSYSYSAGIWWDMINQEGPGRTTNLLAVAPGFQRKAGGGDTSSNTFQSLWYNRAEALAVHAEIKGRTLIGPQATKENFLRSSPHYVILHLATHGKANDESGNYSYLSFESAQGEKAMLTASEIYDLTLQAELVTLSACETGLGPLRSGEGIISLARAFTVAGARSIVSSLWTVNDKSTSILMRGFYRHIGSGMPKDVALQRAKLDYLRGADHSDAHPFYWAGFIPVGDMRPMNFPSPTWKPVLVRAGLILIILAGSLLLFQKKLPILGTKRR